MIYLWLYLAFVAFYFYRWTTYISNEEWMGELIETCPCLEILSAPVGMSLILVVMLAGSLIWPVLTVKDFCWWVKYRNHTNP